MKLPIFKTKRLVLKEVGLQNASSYQKNFNDYEIIRNLALGVPWPYPEDGALSYIRDVILKEQCKDRWIWGIFFKDEPNEIIGCVDLWREGHPEHRGFWLSRKYWGQGLMTEAVEPVTDYAFEDLGFEKLIFSNALGNMASRRVKEKTGARFLRIEKGAFVDPKLTEQEIWELSKSNWKKYKNKN